MGVAGYTPIFIDDLVKLCKGPERIKDFLEGSNKRGISIHGTLVSMEPSDDSGKHIWIDDGTECIRVTLSPRICRRPDIKLLKLTASVSVIGLAEISEPGKVWMCCHGFQVQTDLTMEIYHWSKCMHTRKYIKKWRTTTAATTADSPLPIPPPLFAGRNRSLSSQPSPARNKPNIFKDKIVGRAEKDDDNESWHLSPELPFATSTPVSISLMSDSQQHSSPFKRMLSRTVANLDDGSAFTFASDDDKNDTPKAGNILVESEKKSVQNIPESSDGRTPNVKTPNSAASSITLTPGAPRKKMKRNWECIQQ